MADTSQEERNDQNEENLEVTWLTYGAKIYCGNVGEGRENSRGTVSDNMSSGAHMGNGIHPNPQTTTEVNQQLSDIVDPGGREVRKMLEDPGTEDVVWEQDARALNLGEEMWKPEEQKEEFWCGLRYVEGKTLPSGYQGTIMEVTLYLT